MKMLLHVEDADADAVLFRAALDHAKIVVSVYRVSDGEEALRFLSRSAPYAEVKRPDVVFLDLNMPRVNGWQVLATMRADENLHSIPVVVLSTSGRADDIERAAALGARHYLQKPHSFQEWVTEIDALYKNLRAAGLKHGLSAS
jgi:chemotaxis family two-component system response regulator Rcp1